ncbi:MAG: ABC transporter permease [Deltaproteobacteria bacterium]|nr:ABC transporter permease [Deltaproteobacteria bacterium]MBW2129134.1 ABC transporter permease [Deltaproteobacteria bacterium]MBW2302452.1 ABC transporter permease [Deltaproteobacteria bacterium]
MDFLFDSILSAFWLLWTLDPELTRVIYVSLKVSILSTLFAGLAGVPAGFLIAFREFRLKRALLTVLNSLLALPTVVVGLLVYAFLSRKGPLGMLDLLYTQTAIVIGQIILVFPIVTSLTIAAVGQIDTRYRKTAMTLGATPFQTALAVFREARFAVMAAVIAAFGRVIAEVGISMMLGGNVKGYTRTMTTAMALEYDKGEFVLAVALGIALLFIAFGVNVFLNYIQGRTRS